MLEQSGNPNILGQNCATRRAAAVLPWWAPRRGSQDHCHSKAENLAAGFNAGKYVFEEEPLQVVAFGFPLKGPPKRGS